MKVWTGFGSEHSYRLVLVGEFAEERDAELVVEKFDELREIASGEVGSVDWDDPNPSFSDELYEKLGAMKVYSLSRPDIEGFGYLYGMERRGKTITLRTDDAELQGLLKLLFDHRARVQIYSLHHWTEDGEPRGESDEGQPEAEETAPSDEPAHAQGDSEGDTDDSAAMDAE